MSFDDLQLNGRVAVVTGGSRGIGRGIAELLLERGAAVAIAYRSRADAAAEVVERARANGTRAWAAQCDVADERAVQAFFAEAEQQLGAPDVLVNNAAVTRDAHIMLMDTDRWREVLDVNLEGAYFCTRAVVRGMMLRQWGRIINVSSPSARMPLPGQTSYAASKAGLEGFTRALSRDVAAKGVLVNAVAPGLIETEMLAEHAGGETGALPQRGAAQADRHSARRGLAGRVSRVRRGGIHHGAGHPRRRRAALRRLWPDDMSQSPDELKSEIKKAIVRSLRLPITPEEIGDSTPLFGEGLGLDSIDVLELVLEIERVFGVAISDEATGARVLRSVDSIAEFITTEGTGTSA